MSAKMLSCWGYYLLLLLCSCWLNILTHFLFNWYGFVILFSPPWAMLRWTLGTETWIHLNVRVSVYICLCVCMSVKNGINNLFTWTICPNIFVKNKDTGSWSSYQTSMINKEMKWNELWTFLERNVLLC